MIECCWRDRAAERVILELGPRSEQEIHTALGREVNAKRWTSLDRAPRDISDERLAPDRKLADEASLDVTPQYQ